MTMDTAGERPEEPGQDGENPDGWYFDLPSGAWERQEQKNRELRQRLINNIEDKAERESYGRPPGSPEPPKKGGLFGLGRRKEEPRTRETSSGTFRLARGGDADLPQVPPREDEDEWSSESLAPIDLTLRRQSKEPHEPPAAEPIEQQSRWDEIFGHGEEEGGLAAMRGWAAHGTDETPREHRQIGVHGETHAFEERESEHDEVAFDTDEPDEAEPFATIQPAGWSNEDEERTADEAPREEGDQRSWAEIRAERLARHETEARPAGESATARWEQMFNLRPSGEQAEGAEIQPEGLGAMRAWASKPEDEPEPRPRRILAEDEAEAEDAPRDIPAELLKPFAWEEESGSNERSREVPPELLQPFDWERAETANPVETTGDEALEDESEETPAVAAPSAWFEEEPAEHAGRLATEAAPEFADAALPVTQSTAQPAATHEPAAPHRGLFARLFGRGTTSPAALADDDVADADIAGAEWFAVDDEADRADIRTARWDAPVVPPAFTEPATQATDSTAERDVAEAAWGWDPAEEATPTENDVQAHASGPLEESDSLAWDPEPFEAEIPAVAEVEPETAVEDVPWWERTAGRLNTANDESAHDAVEPVAEAGRGADSWFEQDAAVVETEAVAESVEPVAEAGQAAASWFEQDAAVVETEAVAESVEPVAEARQAAPSWFEQDAAKTEPVAEPAAETGQAAASWFDEDPAETEPVAEGVEPVAEAGQAAASWSEQDAAVVETEAVAASSEPMAEAAEVPWWERAAARMAAEGEDIPEDSGASGAPSLEPVPAVEVAIDEDPWAAVSRQEEGPAVAPAGVRSEDPWAEFEAGRQQAEEREQPAAERGWGDAFGAAGLASEGAEVADRLAGLDERSQAGPPAAEPQTAAEEDDPWAAIAEASGYDTAGPSGVAIYRGRQDDPEPQQGRRQEAETVEMFLPAASAQTEAGAFEQGWEGDDDDVVVRAFEARASEMLPEEREPERTQAEAPDVALNDLLGAEGDQILQESAEQAAEPRSFGRLPAWAPQRPGRAGENPNDAPWEPDDELGEFDERVAPFLAPDHEAEPASPSWGMDAGVTGEPEPFAAEGHSRTRTRTWVREVVETLLLAVLVFLSVRAGFQNFKVDGSSMYPTLENGQFLIVNKLEYAEVDMGKLSTFVPFVNPGDQPKRNVFHAPQRGDIVVLKDPRKPDTDLIKRIVGLPGETVEIVNGKVYINDHLLEEPYIKSPWHDTKPKESIPEGEYYVLGDNRDNSLDSRSQQVGLVPKDLIIGKAMLSYWPMEKFGLAPNGGGDISLKDGPPKLTTQTIISSR